MRTEKMLAILLLLAPVPAAAQSSQSGQPAQSQKEAEPQPSLAEIARQNKAKKQAASAPSTTTDAPGKRVITNDQAERRVEPRRISLWDLLKEADDEDRAAAESRLRRARETREQAEDEQGTTTSISKRENKKYLSQEQDPEYYLARLQPLREELARVNAELRRLRNDSTYDYRTQSVVSSSDANSRTPTISSSRKYEMERYEPKQRDLEKRIAEIEEEAARHGVGL